MQTSQAKIHEMSYCSPQMRLFVWGFCSVENINLVPHSLLPSITTMGPFPCTFTLRFRPVITMKDHFTLRYPLTQAGGRSHVHDAKAAFVDWHTIACAGVRKSWSKRQMVAGGVFQKGLWKVGRNFWIAMPRNPKICHMPCRIAHCALMPVGKIRVTNVAYNCPHGYSR